MKKLFLTIAVSLAAMTAFAQAPKFAHVNFSELVQLMPEADQAREAMTAASNEAQETYMAMTEEFNSKYQTYQQKSASWTPAIRETKEKELTGIQQRIQEFEQMIQQELQIKQQELMAPIYEKAQNAVKKLAKDGGYVMVFESGSLLYLDEDQATDLTPAARKALNIPDGRTLETLQAELQAQQAAQQQ